MLADHIEDELVELNTALGDHIDVVNALVEVDVVVNCFLV